MHSRALTESGKDNQGQQKTARDSVGSVRSVRQVFRKRYVYLNVSLYSDYLSFAWVGVVASLSSCIIN